MTIGGKDEKKSEIYIRCRMQPFTKITLNAQQISPETFKYTVTP